MYFVHVNEMALKYLSRSSSIMKHKLICGYVWHAPKKLLLKKNNKYIFIAAKMLKQDMKFSKYHKAHATNFKFVCIASEM